MKLYLAVNLPEGKRVRVKDKWTNKVDYKSAVVLYPKKATEVDDDLADKLIEQDPHLVSKVPFSEKSELVLNPPSKGDFDEILQQLAEVKFEDMKSTEIVEWGMKLDIEIPHQIPRREKIQMPELG
jgi:predicted DNA-binding antitoxin AbrB/MazE fold protein